MEFPIEAIKKGNFVLHSGRKTNTFYDVNEAITNRDYLEYILSRIPIGDHYVGIATGGAIIAALIQDRVDSNFSIVKDGELKGESQFRDYVLIDDVVTTETSLREAISIIGKSPLEIFVVVDRREEKDKKLKVTSLFEA